MDSKDINQLEIESASNKVRYYSVIESLLYVSGEPLSLKEIASIIECDEKFTKDLMNEIIERYNNNEERGIKIIIVKESYQLVTKPDNSDFVQKLLKTNIRQSLSQAALETLAIIAYKQPITRIDIEDIRGVKSDRAIYTLAEKKLIKESGRKEVPGRPILYVTTAEFLKYFELENLNDMPPIESFYDEEINEMENNIESYIAAELEHKE